VTLHLSSGDTVLKAVVTRRDGIDVFFLEGRAEGLVGGTFNRLEVVRGGGLDGDGERENLVRLFLAEAAVIF